MVVDIAARTIPDPNAPMFAHLDDKWLFSREQMTAMAREAGFAEVRLVPHNSGPRLYQLIGPIQLRLATRDARTWRAGLGHGHPHELRRRPAAAGQAGGHARRHRRVDQGAVGA